MSLLDLMLLIDFNNCDGSVEMSLLLHSDIHIYATI